MLEDFVLKTVDPTGIGTEKGRNYAPRLHSLDGKRMGLVWNTKPNGDVLLDEVGKILTERYPTLKVVPLCTSTPEARTSSGTPPAKGRLEAIAAEVDAVIYASGE